MPKPKARFKKMWGGYVEGRLFTMEVDTGWGGFGTGDRTEMPAIFTTRKSARKKFQDVRPLIVRMP